VRLCVISGKECWQDSSGAWWSYGGFPMQMAAVSSLFDDTTLVIVRGRSRAGGIPLAGVTRVTALRSPVGADLRRKFSVAGRLPYYLWAIARHVREADVVHVPAPGDISILGMLVTLACRKPLLVRYGSSWAPTSQTTMANRLTKTCMRQRAGGRNVMLATGEGASPPARGVQWVFATALSRSELEAIRPCFDRALCAPPRLVYAGRLSVEKGVAVLLRALALLKAEDRQRLPHLTVVGDGPARRDLELLTVDLGCAEQVRFVGHCDRQALSQHLMQADLCVQPSLTEGFSKAWLDAMAHGLPVLASTVGAAPSVIGTDEQDARGWLVPPGDPRLLARRLREALDTTRDWPALRRRCRAFVEGRTLEAWTTAIGHACAAQWNLALVDGKLRR